MSGKRSTVVKIYGDPNSELNIHRCLRFLRETDDGSGGPVYVPKHWVDEYPVIARAVAEFDWLRVED